VYREPHRRRWAEEASFQLVVSFPVLPVRRRMCVGEGTPRMHPGVTVLIRLTHRSLRWMVLVSWCLYAVLSTPSAPRFLESVRRSLGFTSEPMARYLPAQSSSPSPMISPRWRSYPP
ncbi:unnamed protein product, partial [Ectocarpus fasciculatus]